MLIETKATKNDKIVIIYHGEDFDGKCSGTIVYNYFKKLGTEDKNIVCIPIDYSKTVKVEKLIDRIVFVLDFSFPPELMFEMLTNTKELHWVDHHVQALDKYEEYKFEMDMNYDIPGKRHRLNNKGACELTWEYLYGNNTPKTIKLLSAFDVCGDPYSSKNDPQMMSFQYGLRTYDTKDIRSSLWRDLIYKGTDVFRKNICDRGESILKYEEILKEERLEYDGTVVSLYNEDNDLISNDIFLINKNKPGIIFTYELRQKHHFVCTYSHDFKKGYKCTIYTARHNLSAAHIAQMFGGGGHREAAGFRCKELPFTINKK